VKYRPIYISSKDISSATPDRALTKKDIAVPSGVRFLADLTMNFMSVDLPAPGRF
jgi:hypothetical protein